MRIDATNKVLGRLACSIAKRLQEKDSAAFLPNVDKKQEIIEIENISKIKITGNKAKQKKYYHHTGYPGGIKEKKFKDLFIENPGEVLRIAVLGMLPKNKLRAKRIKRLKII